MSDQKETIYIDIDDEITSIIDKVTSSKKKVVALVLPKRATVMQSIVNMKLLKRACDEASKSIVLITSEAGVLPLAGAVGIYVAKTLQTKPFIPTNEDDLEDEDVSEEPELEPEIDETKSVGELAGTPVEEIGSESEEEAIEVDNDIDEVAETTDSIKDAKPKKSKKDKKLKIPNFDSFRKKLLLGLVILVLLAGGWYYAFFVMPTAKITLKTDTTTTAVDLTFVADPAVKTVDEANKIVPALVKESKKTVTQKVPTTGEKNLGDKAKGDVTLSLNDCSEGQVTLPAGTVISSGSQNFVTEEVASLTSIEIGNVCKNSEFPDLSTDKVKVIAQSGGDQFNLSARAYAVAGHTNVTGAGSNMTGGTNKIVKIVSQADIDTGKNKSIEQNTDAIKSEVSGELTSQGFVAISETFVAGTPNVTNSPNVGDEANEVTVSIVTGYTMLGAQSDAIKKLIEAEAKKQIDTSKQTISDDGLKSAVYQLFERKPDGQTRLNLKTNVVAGPQLNADDLKKQVAGKRRGEIQQLLNIPGVKDIDIHYSPFWVTKTPTNQNKITIIFENESN